MASYQALFLLIFNQHLILILFSAKDAVLKSRYKECWKQSKDWKARALKDALNIEGLSSGTAQPSVATKNLISH